jgi:hypothetical protein
MPTFANIDILAAQVPAWQSGQRSPVAPGRCVRLPHRHRAQIPVDLRIGLQCVDQCNDF